MRSFASVVVILLGVSCVAGPDGTSGRRDAIVDGELDSTPQVVIVGTRFGSLCTGTLIAPRVVLTAKHCVQGGDQPGPWPATAFYIGIGDSINRVSRILTAQSVRTTPGTYEDTQNLDSSLVGHDVGLLTLAAGVTDIEPWTVRLTSPTDQIGLDQTAIGYGQTPSGQVGIKFKGMTTIRYMNPGVIYTDTVVCQGDSGGPLRTMDTEEVIGVASFGTGECGSGIDGYNRIDTPEIATMIDEVIEESGACLNDGAERCDGEDNDCNDEVDEVCTAIGGECENSDECVGVNCQDTPGGRVCTVACDFVAQTGCPEGMYCARTSGCDGLCSPGTAGEGAEGEACDADTDCESLFCLDPGDGEQRCLVPCVGDAGGCGTGEVCAAVPDECSGCVDAALVGGARGLGEPCEEDVDCGSDACLSEEGIAYCTRACAADGDCETGFHCRDQECVAGPRAGIGGVCVANGDCESGLICAQRAGVEWCTDFCETDDDCPPDFGCAAAGEANVCAPNKGLPGEACETGDDCISTLCATVGDESVCTHLCGTRTRCGVGFECRSTSDGDEEVCLRPDAGTTTRKKSSGCATSNVPSSTALWFVVPFVLVFARARRWNLRKDS